MGTSSLAATLDDTVIHCAYYREIVHGESPIPVDLAISVKHQYINSGNIVKEIVLEQFVISKEYLETKGLLGVSEVEQVLEFHVLNLRYLTNLFIEVGEVRDGVPVLTRVGVLHGGDYETVNPLPSNPERSPDFEENLPEVVPDKNILMVNTDIGALYLLQDAPLVPKQISKRIFLVEECGEQYFMQSDYNEQTKNIYIENSINNLLPNPQFAGSGEIPDLWEIDAPAIIVNSSLQKGEIEGTNIWQIRASNTNVFNAFNTVSLKTSQKYDLYSGLNSLTFSIFYKIKCSSKEIPFHNFEVRINFFNNDILISSREMGTAATKELKIWRLLALTIQGSQIPVGANKYSIEVDIANLDSTDQFQVSLYLPQLEASPCATTRTVDARIEDIFVTGNTFEVNLPFYILVTTHHVTGAGTRGLCSSTTNQMNGFEFQSSNDRLRFKWYDVTGNITLNLASDPFPITIQSNEIINYGIMITVTNIDFYINGNLLSSHTNTVVIDQNRYYTVGSLEKSNTTINSQLLDFKILRYVP